MSVKVQVSDARQRAVETFQDDVAQVAKNGFVNRADEYKQLTPTQKKFADAAAKDVAPGKWLSVESVAQAFGRFLDEQIAPFNIKGKTLLSKAEVEQVEDKTAKYYWSQARQTAFDVKKAAERTYGGLFAQGGPTEATKPQAVADFTNRFGLAPVDYAQARTAVLQHIATNRETWNSVYGYVSIQVTDAQGLPAEKVPTTFNEVLAGATLTFKPDGYDPQNPTGNEFTFLLKLDNPISAFAWYMVDRQTGDVTVQIDD